MLFQLIFKIGVVLAIALVLIVNLTQSRVIWQGSLCGGSSRVSWSMRNYLDCVHQMRRAAPSGCHHPLGRGF